MKKMPLWALNPQPTDQQSGMLAIAPKCQQWFIESNTKKEKHNILQAN